MNTLYTMNRKKKKGTRHDKTSADQSEPARGGSGSGGCFPGRGSSKCKRCRSPDGRSVRKMSGQSGTAAGVGAEWGKAECTGKPCARVLVQGGGPSSKWAQAKVG